MVLKSTSACFIILFKMCCLNENEELFCVHTQCLFKQYLLKINKKVRWEAGGANAVYESLIITLIKPGREGFMLNKSLDIRIL